MPLHHVQHLHSHHAAHAGALLSLHRSLVVGALATSTFAVGALSGWAVHPAATPKTIMTNAIPGVVVGPVSSELSHLPVGSLHPIGTQTP